MAGLESLQAVSERVMHEAMKMKQILQWRSQEVKDDRKHKISTEESHEKQAEPAQERYYVVYKPQDHGGGTAQAP
jgi:hypothetical protein